MTGRTRRTAWSLAVVLLCGVTAACGVQPSGVIQGASPPSGQLDTDGSVTLYLVADGELNQVQRDDQPRSRAAVLALLADGPTDSERARGLRSAVPSDAAPFTVTTHGHGRIEVEPSRSPAEMSETAVHQIMCTVAATAHGQHPHIELGAPGSSTAATTPGSHASAPTGGGC